MISNFDSALIPKRAKKYFEANRNVLVIEDDRTMSQMIGEMLDDAGFRVKTVTNGKAAFEMLQQRPINFILLDLLLPEMDGFEIFSRLQLNPDTKDIPVMIVSAWADERKREQGTRLGIRHFLLKPFTEDELMFSILTLLVDTVRQDSHFSRYDDSSTSSIDRPLFATSGLSSS